MEFIMKKLIGIVFFLHIACSALASDKIKCSTENLEKLLDISSKIIGELGSYNIATTKLFDVKNLDKTSAAELRKKYLKINEEKVNKTTPLINELNLFVKEHPECDLDHKFSLRISK